MKPPVNSNYCATVVELKEFKDLPGCDRLKAAMIFGNQVIVSKDTQSGTVGLFFPLEVALSKEFLSFNNLYRKPEWGNVDPTAKGLFEESGRVRAVRLRGHKSEGFFVGLSSLEALGVSAYDPKIGLEFDEWEGIPICKKYVPKRNGRVPSAKGDKKRTTNKIDLIVADQFRFHPDTQQLRKNMDRIVPETIFSISRKIHGTSIVIGNLLIKRTLNWKEKIAAWLGIKVEQTEYGIVCSSRKVIKTVNSVSQSASHWYPSDIWGDVAKEVEHLLPEGYTIYGEIVGFTKDGTAIQKDYSYGCKPGEHKLAIYRVTLTNPYALVLELSWEQMREFCAKYGFEMVEEYFYGRADAWAYAQRKEGKPLLEMLSEVYLEKDCKESPGLPDEGVVVRIDHLRDCESYKLKSFRFLQGETISLDAGIVDLETQQSDEEVA